MTMVRHRPRPRGAAWLAVLLATLVAFGWQSFVTQTHIHFVRDRSDAAMRAGAAAPSHIARRQAPSDTPEDCPICRDMAVAGHYLSPAAVLIVAPAVVAVWRTVAAPLTPARTRPSHAWRSRAPPTDEAA